MSITNAGMVESWPVNGMGNRGNRGQTTFCIYGVFVTIVQSFKKRVIRGVVCRPKAVFS